MVKREVVVKKKPSDPDADMKADRAAKKGAWTRIPEKDIPNAFRHANREGGLVTRTNLINSELARSRGYRTSRREVTSKEEVNPGARLSADGSVSQFEF